MPDEIQSLDQATEALLAADGAAVTTESAPVEEPDATATAEKTYTAAEYKALQAESKANREKAQTYDKLYGQNSELRQFHEAAQAYADGDITSTQTWLLENAAAVLGISRDELVEKFNEPDDEDDKPLTRREWKELQKAERESQAQERNSEQAMDAINYARSLGYEPGSRPYRRLFDLAMNETDNDIDAAHKIMETEPAGVIDGYLKTQREKAKGGLRSTPAARVPGTAREITSWKDAEAGAMEFLNERL